MVLSDVVLTGIIAAVVAIITSLITSFISFRTVKTEILSTYRQDLINRQVTACEMLWEALNLASKAKGDNFVIRYKDDKQYINLTAAKKLHQEITEVFNSKYGLYYSLTLREEIFGLRRFIESEFLELDLSSQSSPTISKTKAKSFFGRVGNLRIALRKEIGVENLTVGKEGPVEGD